MHFEEQRRPAATSHTEGRNLASCGRRYLGIYGALIKNSVTRELMFKTNFLLWLVVEALWFGLQLSFISVLYLHTETIGSWTKWQVVLLTGASFFIQQIFQAFFLVNLVNLSELVRSGKLDFLLLVPANTRFIVSFRPIGPGCVHQRGFGCGDYDLRRSQAGTNTHLGATRGLLALCLAGIAIHYSLMFLLASISFWTVRAQGIVWGYYNLFNIARMPDEAFRGLFRAVFTFVLPMLLVSNVPARVLTDKLSEPKPVLLLLLMALACFALSEAGWKASIKRYTSASS